MFRRLTSPSESGAEAPAGVLLYGMGGVGKSTLAARLLEKCQVAGFTFASVVGTTSPDGVLATVAKRMRALAVQHGLPERSPAATGRAFA